MWFPTLVFLSSSTKQGDQIKTSARKKNDYCTVRGAMSDASQQCTVDLPVKAHEPVRCKPRMHKCWPECDTSRDY